MHFTKLAIFFAMTFIQQTQAADLSYPKLFFNYSFLYDQVCAPTNPVDEKWAKEAYSKEVHFKSIWEKDAPALFSELFKEFGKGFSRKEITATLSVCPRSQSFSNPLVLNVVPYLKSYRGTQPVREDFKFVQLVFHELLHTWLVENYNRTTPLRDKYKNEPKVTINHLHLMAVEKLIYKKLGRTDLLNWINEDYSEKSASAYARAWEIVDKIEGYEAFVTELKSQ